MNRITYIFLIAVFGLFISCKNEGQPEVKTVEVEATETSKKLNPNATYAKAEFGIDGMTCEIGCAKTIEKKLAKMDGVKSASVDFDRQLAMVEYDEAVVTPSLLTETVTNVADTYKVKDMKTVDEFSKEKKECSEECKKECCKDKDKSELKASSEKKACKEDCKMACCANKA